MGKKKGGAKKNGAEAKKEEPAKVESHEPEEFVARIFTDDGEVHVVLSSVA